MPNMLVTLDVSKLSGWFNTDACCRVTPRLAWRATQGGERREGVGGRGGGARSVHGGTDWTLGTARARGVRTSNMRIMSVMLDVSKLSGWLKAAAACRGRKQGV